MRLRRLEPILRRALSGPCALPRGSRVLVAVSGGADSTALLIALARVAPEFGLTLHAAHLHHGLRGAAADRDLRFVERLCARLKVPLDAARRDTRRLMRERGLSGQAGLRTLRRAFLLAAARRAGAHAIATAHTAHDQLETLLLRLGRGTGFAGLAGMAPRRGRWIKPLLVATRGDIVADLRRAGEKWREDHSNRDLAYARNRIRRVVLPAWARALAPGGDAHAALESLARHAARATAEVGAARRAIAARARRLVLRARAAAGSRGALACFDARTLARAQEAVRNAAVTRAWRTAAPGGPGLLARHRADLERLLRRTGPGGRVELPAGLAAERRGALLAFVPARQLPPAAPRPVRGPQAVKRVRGAEVRPRPGAPVSVPGPGRVKLRRPASPMGLGLRAGGAAARSRETLDPRAPRRR